MTKKLMPMIINEVLKIHLDLSGIKINLSIFVVMMPEKGDQFGLRKP